MKKNSKHTQESKDKIAAKMRQLKQGNLKAPLVLSLDDVINKIDVASPNSKEYKAMLF